MEPTSIIQATSGEPAGPLRPFSFVTPDGTFDGIGASDPQYKPGSDEYRLRSNDQQRALNWRIFDAFARIDPDNPFNAGRSSIERGADEPQISELFRNLKNSGALAGTNGTAQDAAWYVVNVMQPQARHDAKYVFNKIRPAIAQMVKEGQESGRSFYPAELNFEDIISIATKSGVDPYVINKLVAEEGEVNVRKSTKSYTYGQLKPMVDMLDPESTWGEMVFNDPKTHLFTKTGEARRDAFKAMARWKDKHGVSFLGSLIEGVGHLAVEGGYALGGFAEGSIGSLVAVGTAGQFLMENGTYVLSDAWIQRPEAERNEAQDVLIRAHELAKKYGPEFVNAKNEFQSAAVIERRFGELADPADVETFQRLSELRRNGAYRPQMSWERLANFGEGVLNAVPSLVKLFNSSVDPNSALFRYEVNTKSGSVGPMGGDAFGVRSAWEAWWKSSQTYKDIEASELDKTIDIWSENYNDLMGNGESVTGFFYRKSAEVAEAVGAKGLGSVYREGETAAKGIMQEKRLIEAGALVDPVLTFVGALKLVGVGAKAAKTTAALESISSDIRTITAEASKLRASANIVSAEFDTAVARIRTEIEKLIPGAQFTDDDVIGIAISDRRSAIGQLPAAQLIRKEIGRTISKNKSLAEKVKEIEKRLDDIPDDTAGIDKLRARPVGGAVMKGVSKAESGVAYAVNAVADFLDENYATAKGGGIRKALSRGARFLVRSPIGSGSVSVSMAGAYLAQGDILGAALAGGGYIGLSQLLRPEYLRSFGTSVSQVSRIQGRLAANVSEGKRYGDSAFLRTAIDFETEARNLNKTINRVPGVPLSPEDAAKVEKINQLADDAAVLRRLHKGGIEDAFRNASKVVWEDGFIAGLTGSVIAGLNDEDAMGSGAGLSIGFSAGLRGLNRLYQVTPAGAAPTYNRAVLGDMVSILSEIKDPEQRGNIISFLGKAGDDPQAYLRRVSIVRDLYISTRGRARFVNGTEFEAATILTSSPEAEATMIMSEAQALYPNDPAKAKEYALIRKDALDKARQASHRVTALHGDIATNKANMDAAQRNLVAIDNQIKDLEVIVEAERTQWTDLKKVDQNRIKLERLQQARSEVETSIEVMRQQQQALDGDLAKAKGEAAVDRPMRPYERRAMPNGSTVTSVSDAFYVVDGPQGKSVYVNIDKADNIGVISEGWHSLLSDSAIESLMPEMVSMLIDGYSPETGETRAVDAAGNAVNKRRAEGGRVFRAISNDAFSEILKAYTADMSPEHRAKYMADAQAGLRRYIDSGYKDISGIIEPTREVMTWILSAIDMRRRIGTRPGLATRPGAESTSYGAMTGTRDISKILFGERTISDELKTFVTAMFDPVYGTISRKYANSMHDQLTASGMRFVESGDGTLRGYFLNEKNEIVRSELLNDFYDRVVSMTGGRGSPLIRPINLYDPMVPVETRVDFVRRNGMDWVLNDAGTDILPPEEVARKSTGFVKSIEDSLSNLPETMRRMEVYTDADGNRVYTGIPSPAEMAAIAKDPNIPESFKRNILTVMQTLSSGESKAVLRAEYSNVFSVNTDALTDHRLRVGKDIAGKTEMRSVIPLSFTIGDSPVYGADGKVIKVTGADGKKVPLKQKVVKMLGVDVPALKNSFNHAFQQGLFIIDEATGKREYLKDPSGNPYTAANLKMLFGSEAEFWNQATVWMNHYYKSGPIDPHAPIPMNPDGSPKTRIPVSAEVLDPINPARGAAQRDALRMIFGLESGKKRLGWVEDNRKTNTATGVVIRGTNFPITNYRLDQFGPLTATGESMFIDQRGATSGQFVMSIKDWGKVNVGLVNGRPTMVLTDTFIDLGGRFMPSGSQIFVNEVRTHPTIADAKMFIGYEESPAGKREKILAYTLGDGRIIKTSFSKERDVINEMRAKLGNREDLAWTNEALVGPDYKGDPLFSTEAPKGKVSEMLFDPVENAADILPMIEAYYAKDGRKIPPNMKAFIMDQNLESFIKGNGSLNDIISALQRKAKEERDGSSTGIWKDRYRNIDSQFGELWREVYEVSEKQAQAYRVPSNIDVPVDAERAISKLFALERAHDPTFSNPNNRAISELFDLTRENFTPGQFASNKEYIEAVLQVLDKKLDDVASLEGEEFEVQYKRLSYTKDKVEFTYKLLQKQHPELFAEKTKAAESPEATGQAKPSLPTDPSTAVDPATGLTPTRALPEAPEMTDAEIQETKRVRVSNDGTVKTVPDIVLSFDQQRRIRYNAMLDWNRKYTETLAEDTAAFNKSRKEQEELLLQEWEKRASYQQRQKSRAEKLEAARAEKERKKFIAEQNARWAQEVASEEKLAAQYRRKAKEQAAADARAAAEAQRLADQAQAKAEAARLAFERGIEILKAKEQVKGEITRKLVADALNSNDPLIAPGLLLVDFDRLPIAIERNVSVADTVNIPFVSTRTNVVYLRNWNGFEAQTKAFQQSTFNYLFSEQSGRGQRIAAEAFGGPMAAQQGINLVNSRMWIADGSGARLFREYKNADKAAGRDIITYKVYAANGSLIKETQDAVDALKAIENLERRFQATLGVSAFSPKKIETPEDVIEVRTRLAEGYLTPPTPQRPSNTVQKEKRLSRIRDVDKYLPVKPR
jgi:hypothetical protein